MNSEICENVEMQIKIDGAGYTIHVDPNMPDSEFTACQYVGSDNIPRIIKCNGVFDIKKKTYRKLRRLARPSWQARIQLWKHGISLKRWEIDIPKYNRANRRNKMKLFMRKYYPSKDFDRNCKHKMPMQETLSCRKRRDGTKIGSKWCVLGCQYCYSFGRNKKNELWIKCDKLKEALRID